MLGILPDSLLRKYIPRAYPSLKGLAGIHFTPTVVLNTGFLSPLYSREAGEAYQRLAEIAAEDAKAGAATGQYMQKLTDMGFPGLLSGMSEAPYDILGDYFRGTMGIFEDLTDDSMQDILRLPAISSRISRSRLCSI